MELQFELDGNKWIRLKPIGEKQMLLVVWDERGSTDYLLDLQSLGLKKTSVDGDVLSNHGWKGLVVLRKT